MNESIFEKFPILETRHLLLREVVNDDMHLQRIFGRVDPKNIPSARILQKLGYHNEGVKVDDEFARGRFFDMKIWARENQQ